VPTITSDKSSLPEIAGQAAILIDPGKPEEISAALEKILTDKIFQEELKKRGVAQAQKFNWEKCARETLEIYKEVTK
jgi:glycosyltransferase involved in cell wall biosynthesis